MADDFKTHALTTSHDFYELLGLTEAANNSEIRSAYRKATLKYHPDKVGASPDALERWHLLQIAHEVLSDAGVRELYDNARRARVEKSKRDEAFEGRRKWMKEDLERRENGAVKRKREETEAEDAFERELRRIAEDGKRRRREREEALKKEASEAEEQERKTREGDVVTPQLPTGHSNGVGPTDMDRSVTLRIAKTDSTAHIDKQHIISAFERFGPIDDAILRDKKIKLDGEKHRQPYTTVVLVFESIVGAHAAVSDMPMLQLSDAETFGVFEQVNWAAGREPDCVPKAPTPAMPSTDPSRKVPSFAGFKATPGVTSGSAGGPNLDDSMMIRLKNAERRRVEEKARKEEAAMAATTTSEVTGT